MAVCLAAFAVSAMAQTNVTNSNNGTANTVPVYTGSATLGNSPISISGGNVGIGTTTSPSYNLDLSSPASGEPTAFKIRGNAYQGLQLRIANDYSATFGTLFSGAATVLSSNAFQSTLGADAWSKGVSTGSSTQLMLGISSSTGNAPFQINYSKANTSHGILRSFFPTNLMTILGNGNVGIGQSAPGQSLDVKGTIYTEQNGGDPGSILFPDGSRQTTAFPPSNPDTTVNISNAVNANGNILTVSDPGVSTDNGGTLQLINTEKSASTQAYSWLITNWGANNGHGTNGLRFSAYSQSGSSACNPSSPYNPVCFSALTLADNGHVGIGTVSPGYELDVTGQVFASGGIVFPNGVQTVAYTGTTCGGDYAESMDATGERTKYAPGDLLVLDAEHPGKILKSLDAYSTSVAGIYSTKPGTVGRRQLTPQSHTEVPMAMVGVVPAKVTAENGAIHVGDLLVSSSKPGYAMRGTDRSRMLGAVIGKAMGTLDSGAGTIEVLVTLQ